MSDYYCQPAHAHNTPAMHTVAAACSTATTTTTTIDLTQTSSPGKDLHSLHGNACCKQAAARDNSSIVAPDRMENTAHCTLHAQDACGGRFIEYLPSGLAAASLGSSLATLRRTHTRLAAPCGLALDAGLCLRQGLEEAGIAENERKEREE